MGNVSFICRRYEQNHLIKDELCDKKHFILSAFAYRYHQLKKNEQKEIGSSIFRMFSPRRYSSRMPFYFTHHFHSLATSPCGPCGPPPTSAVVSWSTFSQVCPVLGQALRGWLHLVDQHWHRCLNYTYLRSDMLPGSISQIFALLVISLRIASCYAQQSVPLPSCLYLSWQSAVQRFWETIRVIRFIDDSLGVERQYTLMLLFFTIKFTAGQCLMMYDDGYLFMEAQVSCLSL